MPEARKPITEFRTFIDGLNIVTSIAHGRGGVWVLNPPYLLFFADKNHDDVPDSDPVVPCAAAVLQAAATSRIASPSARIRPADWLQSIPPSSGLLPLSTESQSVSKVSPLIPTESGPDRAPSQAQND